MQRHYSNHNKYNHCDCLDVVSIIVLLILSIESILLNFNHHINLRNICIDVLKIKKPLLDAFILINSLVFLNKICLKMLLHYRRS